MRNLYKALMILLTPVWFFLLWRRLKQGKEMPERIRERLGIATEPRHKGTYVWVHAASVGESMMILPFIHKFSALFPQLYFVVTTTTLTSATLLADRLPPQATHQFFPLDQPQWGARFLDYWEPSLVLWAESEFWPNIFSQLKERRIPLFVVNGGLSETSLKRWSYASSLIRETLQAVTLFFSRSPLQGQRLRSLGALAVEDLGNVKFSVSPLPVNEKDLEAFRLALGDRPVWVAASTHEGEEEKIFKAHEEIKKTCPDILTFLVPRHPTRGDELMDQLSQWCPVDRLLRRSSGKMPTPYTEIYVCDTMGELGLFYRLAQVAFVGGSWVPQGGHNPIEPLQLGCLSFYGPHMENFQEVVEVLDEEWFQVKTSEELAAKVLTLIASPKVSGQYRLRIEQILKTQEKMSSRIVDTIEPFLRERYDF